MRGRERAGHLGSAPVASALHIAGTGSFAAQIASWAQDTGRRPVGLIELRDERRVGTTIHGLPVIGRGEPALEAEALIGVGGDRAQTWAVLARSGWRGAEPLVHPAAVLAASARIEVGVTIGPLAVVDAESAVGAHALISRGAQLGHHVAVGDYVSVGPGAIVGGNTTLGRAAFLAIGCVVSNGLSIGEGALVAAGATVVRDVPDGVRVQGVPASPYP
jgi:sugar O-acyltransferase (sialic acid O-acetyltransferase NeuD family)